MSQIILQLCHQTVGVTSQHRDIILKWLSSHNEQDRDLTLTIHSMAKFFADRSSIVLFLTQHELLWDAEIINRTCFEAAIKLAFICFSPTSTRNERIHEYWHALAEVNALKRSENARKVAPNLDKTPEDQMTIEDLILDHEEESAIRERWPRRKRDKLQQTWSFNEITNWLDQRLSKENAHHFRSLRHNYAISSHLAHADETGVNLTQDRAHRPLLQKNAMHLAHAARLLSDQIVCWQLITAGVATALDKDRSELKDLIVNSEPLFMQIHELSKGFYSTL